MMRIGVLGAGLMGHGIALTFARAGHAVTVADPVAGALDALPGRVAESLRLMGAADETDAVLARIAAGSLAGAATGADVLFEAAPEKPDLKRALFAEAERHASTVCLFASNTSVIRITSIMEVLGRPGRAMGTHWWNPPHMIPLVEVVRAERTDTSALDAMEALLREVGKTPVRVEKDVPGFIGNRLQIALWREALALVDRGICDADAVDTVVKASFGRRLAVVGPLENVELIGLDLTLDILDQVLFDLDTAGAAPDTLRAHVAAGRTGMTAGEGFRRWTPDQAAAVRARLARHLDRLDGILGD